MQRKAKEKLETKIDTNCTNTVETNRVSVACRSFLSKQIIYTCHSANFGQQGANIKYFENVMIVSLPIHTHFEMTTFFH